MAERLRVRFTRIPGETPKGVLQRPLYLPAVLGSFGWSEEFQHVEYDTVSRGQFSQPAQGGTRARRLRDIDDIDSLIVAWDPEWLRQEGQDPDDVQRKLTAIGRSLSPVQMLVTPRFPGEARALIRVKVTMRSLDVQIREREADTQYFAVRLKEWRNADSSRKRAGRDGDQLPTTHTLTAEDSLHSLSMTYYKTASGADNIAAANGIRSFGKKTKLIKHPRLKVGTKIKIPKLTKSDPSRPNMEFGSGSLTGG